MNSIENSLDTWLAKASRIFTTERVFLGILFAFGILGIIVSHHGVLPPPLPYAIFYFFLLLLLGLYRPTLLWSLVVFFLPFELLLVAVLPGGMDLRAYQYGAVALGIATLILWLQGRVKLFSVRWFDGALALVVLGSVLAFFANKLPVTNIKDVVILGSFGALYILGRIYVQNKKEATDFVETLLVSGVVVSGYALYQVLAFQYGKPDFMVMPGRPNSVFEEADWLGFFLGMVATMSMIAFLKTKSIFQEIIFGAAFTFFVITLVTTVSRSAWLGLAAAVAVVMLVVAFECVRTRSAGVPTRLLFKLYLGVPVLIVLALFVVHAAKLTRFDLDERLTSTGTGDQVITIACTKESEPPAYVEKVEDLTEYHCQHINLEEQFDYEMKGFVIATTKRPDPNISIRQDLYKQSFALLKKNPVFGLGWGESVKAFGKDGRGAGLNSSNLFIETWLGSGLLGFSGLLIFWVGVASALCIRILKKREMTEGFWWTALILALWVQVSVFNLFNAGILLGTFIAFLILASWYTEKTLPRIKKLWQK